MEPSNGSTTAAAASGDKMNYALQVALQTIKERCIQLQRRVSSMEDENQRLRESASSSDAGCGDIAETQSLRVQVKELQRQKEQLSEQINMVSNENRRLWSRLSQISKEHSALEHQPQLPNKVEDTTAMLKTHDSSTGAAAIGANQNLIRSKTFTQHSPNPRLRQKMISDGMPDISLEEIALDNFGAGETFSGAGDAVLGYPYGLRMDDANGDSDPEDNIELNRCMEGLQDLGREAMKQQQELSSALKLLESRIALQPCPDCAQKAAQKPEMADKSLETDESLNNELKQYHNEPVLTSKPQDTVNGHNGHATNTPFSRLSIVQEKLKADAMEKTCPMCGKLYNSQISFKAFQEHVEMHFIDDAMELESSIERNFEFISHAVGDF